MGKLLVATTNPGKLREIRPLLTGVSCDLVSLADVAPIPEPVETGRTFWENARIKALAYAAGSGLVSVAEDSGLVIDAMDGEPGVLSARFMGASTPYPARFQEIFRRIEGRDRAARFVTALAVARGNEILFETETTSKAKSRAKPPDLTGLATIRSSGTRRFNRRPRSFPVTSKRRSRIVHAPSETCAVTSRPGQTSAYGFTGSTVQAVQRFILVQNR